MSINNNIIFITIIDKSTRVNPAQRMAAQCVLLHFF